MKLAEKTAVVTGAASGIGSEIAMTLAREGANIVIADVDLNSGEKVAQQIKSLGYIEPFVQKMDLTKISDIEHMVEATMSRFNHIDILVNDAGVTRTKPALEITEEDWQTIIDVNLKGLFFCCQAVGKQMIKNKKGKIVNIVSVGGHRGIPGQAVYTASKGGVLQLTKALAVEWAEYHINVNSVSPGITLTPMNLKAGINVERRVARTPTGRANRPEDISHAVLFLVSSEADNITGQDIIVDGGVSVLYWPKGEG